MGIIKLYYVGLIILINESTLSRQLIMLLEQSIVIFELNKRKKTEAMSHIYLYEAPSLWRRRRSDKVISQMICGYPELF